MTDQITLPKPLAEVLDLGGVPVDSQLVDTIHERLLYTPDERRKVAEKKRAFAADFLDGGRYADAPAETRQRMVTGLIWDAEIMEDEALARRYEAVMPEDQRPGPADLVNVVRQARRLATWLEERAETARRIASMVEADPSPEALERVYETDDLHEHLINAGEPLEEMVWDIHTGVRKAIEQARLTT